MKILKEKTIIKIKQEALSKMMDVAKEVYERYGVSVGEIIKDKEGELLDICLKHFYKKPTKRIVYPHIATERLGNFI